MTNPYASPQAPLEQQTLDTEGQGTLQRGINGQYDFSIRDILAEGWEKTNGAKGTLLLAFLIYIVIAGIVNAVFTMIFPDPNALFLQSQYGMGSLWLAVTTLIGIPFTYPLMAGITLLGIRRSVNADITVGTIFHSLCQNHPAYHTKYWANAADRTRVCVVDYPRYLS